MNQLFEEAKKNGEDFLEQLGEMLDEHLDMDGEGDNEAEEGKEEKDSNGNNVSKTKPKYSKTS